MMIQDEKKITIHATRDESSGSQNSYTTKVKIHVFTTMEADGALDDLAEKLSRQFGEKFQEREEQIEGIKQQMKGQREEIKERQDKIWIDLVEALDYKLHV